MNELESMAQPHLVLLHQLFASATQDASAAMSRWTSGLVTLSLDDVQEVPMEQACGAINVGDDLLTMVVLQMEGDIGGEMILTFDEANARQLAASLLRRPAQLEEPWSDLEQSALCETGNILSCAYLNALTRLIGVDLVPSPPYFVQDYGASVLEQALLTQALTSNDVLICRTRFQREGEDLNWHVFFMPTIGLRTRLEAALTGNG